MKKLINLAAGTWRMHECGSDIWHEAHIPGSVYADLMADGTMPDPFYRDNEFAFFELMKKEWEYVCSFRLAEEALMPAHLELVCEGLDTLADVFLNGVLIAHADNMHITWEWDVKPLLHWGENELRIIFRSPINFCAEKHAQAPGWESSDATPGFRHLRKAHCMFGWDWGPRLPDAGVWRPIYLRCWDAARVESALITQQHADDQVTLTIAPEMKGQADWQAIITAPDGAVLTTPVTNAATAEIIIETPALWWPRGYGEQPLYTVEVRAIVDGIVVDTWVRRIGLRTLSISREKDQWGEEFCHIVNGAKIFAMGADYIPEDNILARVTPERTRRLLEDAALANMNTVRIWGGGYYPSSAASAPFDGFYDICDELGLLVWQDLMYACAFYDLTEDFEASIRVETEQNVKRLRHHASLALICGNNEMEVFMGYAKDSLVLGDDRYNPKNHRHVTDYVKMFEYLLPRIVKAHAPDTFWWPASPSSGGDFDGPNDYDRGDVHYWDVWHGEKPFTEYRKFFFRYASEFGFQSFPCLKTVESFTEPGDRNIFSRIMERHQRNGAANGKIMAYLAQTYKYPNSFDDLLYASQLLQAEAIRYGVEHWRRNRGRCMGAIIWQLNDCWPVASWASLDYYGRWKAMHYAAKRFFAPIMISAEEEGELSQNPKINEYRTTPIERSIRLNVANETMQDVTGVVHWALRTADADIVREGSVELTVPALSAKWLDKLVFEDATLTGHYVSFEFNVDGEVVSEGTALFCAPKHFDFLDPQLTACVEGDEIVVHASAFARQVWVESDDRAGTPGADLLLSDNAFDMNAGAKRIRILRGEAKNLRVRSVYDLGR
ncbi:MAG: glycoside hydrolase family 2 protein [Clostridiales bacterium]|nr:glycoside hydrolase family 2 protein [Clostridiales bacterium]